MTQNEFADYLRRLGKSENTIKTYCHNMDQFFQWCRDSFDEEPRQLYRANVLDYISYMRNIRSYHAKTVNNHLSSLRSLNEYLIGAGCQTEIVVLDSDFMKIQIQYASPCTVEQKEVEAFRQRLLEGGNKRDYSCATQLYRKDTECSQIFWSRTEIEEVVLAAYKAQLQVMDEEYREISPRHQAVPLETCRKRQKAITAELERADSRNLKFYEQFREGIFDKEMFLQKKAELFKRKESLEQELAELQAQEQKLIEAQKDMLARREHLVKAKEILHASDDELRERMYDAIDKVTVYSSKELDIAWKLGNVFSSVG